MIDQITQSDFERDSDFVLILKSLQMTARKKH